MAKQDWRHGTRVIFRRFKAGDIIALFPDEPGDNDSDTCMSYQRVGQHGLADAAHIMACTIAATLAEYAELERELVRIGYTDLRAVTRMPSNARRNRQSLLAGRWMLKGR